MPIILPDGRTIVAAPLLASSSGPSPPEPGPDARPGAGPVDGREGTPEPLRFAVMTTEREPVAWEAACVRHLLTSGEARVVLRLISPMPAAPPHSGPAGRLFTLYQGQRLRRLARALKPGNPGAEWAAAPCLRMTAAAGDGASWSVPEDELAALRRFDLDFILYFGPGAPRGGILDAARYGVWSFRHGEEGQGCGLPPCLWEVVRAAPLTSAALEVWRGRRAGGRAVAYRGHFRTEASYGRNLDHVLLGSVDWCVRLARLTRHGQALPAMDAPPRPADAAARPPTGGEIATYLGRRARAAAEALFRRLFVLETWNVGLVAQCGAALPGCRHPGPTEWLPQAPRGRFYADPFPLVADGTLHIMLEVFDWRAGRGWIGCVTPSTGTVRDRVIDMGVHMSYPYVFWHEGRLYCVPETFEAGALHLFEAVDVPTRWRHRGPLLDGVAAVDATIFVHEGRWWLFCTDKDTDPDACLYAWHADSPLGPWVPHPLNPLKCDPRSARPAGRPFMADGALHRPAQDCSHTYGGAVVLNRVARLTPTAFREETVCRLDADPQGNFPMGLHTLCPEGGITVIDGKRYQLDAAAWLLKWQGRRARRHAAARQAAGQR